MYIERELEVKIIYTKVDSNRLTLLGGTCVNLDD